MTLDECDSLFSTIRSGSSDAAIRGAIRALFSAYPILSFSLERGSIYWRGRYANAAGFKRGEDLGAPPPHLTRINRLNEHGQPRLYVATQIETVLAELNAQPGDYIHLAGFRMLTDAEVRFATFGDYFHVHKRGYLRLVGRDPGGSIRKSLNENYDEGQRTIYIDALLSEILADPLAWANGYRTTRILARETMKKVPVDGFFYPSVRDSAGMNLVVSARAASEKMHMVASRLIRLAKARDFNFHEYDVLAEATGLSDDGDLIMRPPESLRRVVVFNMTEQEYNVGQERGADDPETLEEMLGYYHRR